jgi:hypothetical protein
MKSNDPIIDLDRFRRLRKALSGMAGQNALKREESAPIGWNLSGFTAKARVETTFGELPIEVLRIRDDLRTYSGAAATVQAVDKIHLDADFIRNNPRSLPIRIPANAFGPGKPIQELLLSPGQEVCPDRHVASAFCGARSLPDRFTMDLSQASGFTYFRFHCGSPAIVKVEGVWVRTEPWTETSRQSYG